MNINKLEDQNHLESFNKTFDIKTKKITCLECGTPKKGKDSIVNIYDNVWWICPGCEEELRQKLECFNTDFESGINYNLSNQY